jgi:ribosomal protein S27AE
MRGKQMIEHFHRLLGQVMKRAGLFAATVFGTYFFLLFFFRAGFSAGVRTGHLTALALTALIVAGIWYILDFRVFARKRVDCSRCGGTGYLTDESNRQNPQQPCPSCAGAGSTSELKNALVVLGLLGVCLTFNIMGLRMVVSTKRTQQPLHVALQSRKLDEVRRLLEAGANPNAVLDMGTGHTYPPLHLAIPTMFPPNETDNDVALLELLLKHGAEIDAQDSYGRTALMSAVVSAVPRCAVLLIEKGADPSIPDSAKWTVLRTALWLPQLKVPVAPDGPTPFDLIRDALIKHGHKVPEPPTGQAK